jgi:hypothetical protein
VKTPAIYQGPGPWISHRTIETNDRQTFALGPDNFSQDALEAIGIMQHKPVLGYRLYVNYRGAELISFEVRNPAGATLTRNTVRLISVEPMQIDLSTSFRAAMVAVGPGEADLIADLEQCAAVWLVTQWRNGLAR